MTYAAEPAWGRTFDVDISDNEQSSKQGGKSREAE